MKIKTISGEISFADTFHGRDYYLDITLANHGLVITNQLQEHQLEAIEQELNKKRTEWFK